MMNIYELVLNLSVDKELVVAAVAGVTRNRRWVLIEFTCCGAAYVVLSPGCSGRSPVWAAAW